jgi:hypothetical protein
MDAQRIAVDAIVVLTGSDRDEVAAFIRRLYLSGVKDPKRLTFKGLQAVRGRSSALILRSRALARRLEGWQQALVTHPSRRGQEAAP